MGMVLPQTIFAICLLGALPTYGSFQEIPSLFFPEEVDQKPPVDPHQLTVGAIVWKGPEDWSFWAGRERVTPQIPHPLFEVTDITTREVTVTWHKTGDSEVLKPGVRVTIP
jgi:hypothetical protein